MGSKVEQDRRTSVKETEAAIAAAYAPPRTTPRRPRELGTRRAVVLALVFVSQVVMLGAQIQRHRQMRSAIESIEQSRRMREAAIHMLIPVPK